MRRVLALAVVFTVVLGVSALLDAQTDRSPLEGAWVLQDWSSAKPPAFKVNKPTGMLVISGNHYATVILMDSSTRPEVGAGGASATKEDLLAAWGPLRAQAGTVKVSGDKVTFKATIAKGTPPMAPGAFGENTFTVKGDSLVLVSSRNQDGPSANPETRRYTRAK